MKAAYMARPEGNIDQVIREALTLQHTKISEPRDTADRLKHKRFFHPFIAEFFDSTLYFSPHARLQSTSYIVRRFEDNDLCSVGIQMTTKSSELALKTLIEFKEIKGVLIPGGLKPISSMREQIPEGFLSEIF
ncbi:hypothetical protein GOV12_00775 [Candidatus Pacearchaeota archaeon]|nr:hypothetical protein [Candidatus Pacearchaeota archaeon]